MPLRLSGPGRRRRLRRGAVVNEVVTSGQAFMAPQIEAAPAVRHREPRIPSWTKKAPLSGAFLSAPGEIRTPDLRFRRPRRPEQLLTTVDGIPLQFIHVSGRDLGVHSVIAKAGSCDVWAGIGPQPSLYARRTLALICDRFPSEYAETTGRILAEDVHANAPNAPEPSRVPAALTQRGLFDGMPVIVEALLAGDADLFQ